MSIGVVVVAGLAVPVFAAPPDPADPAEELPDPAAAADPAVIELRPAPPKSDAAGSGDARKSDVMNACGVPGIPGVAGAADAAAVDAEPFVGHGVNGKPGC